MLYNVWRANSTSRRIRLTRGNDKQKLDRHDRFNWSAAQCCLNFPLKCGCWCFSGRPIELFHSILQNLSAGRMATMSIRRRLYGAWTQRQIFLGWWLIFSYFVGPWNRPYKARFHEPTKPVDGSTLVVRLEAKDEKFGLRHRWVSSTNQKCLVVPLYYGQRPVNDRPIDIDLFGRSERLVWATKWSSDRLTKNIRHVKYFAQKSRLPVDSSATLDAQKSVLVVGSQENIMVGPWNCNFWVSTIKL